MKFNYNIKHKQGPTGGGQGSLQPTGVGIHGIAEMIWAWNRSSRLLQLLYFSVSPFWTNTIICIMFMSAPAPADDGVVAHRLMLLFMSFEIKRIARNLTNLPMFTQVFCGANVETVQRSLLCNFKLLGWKLYGKRYWLDGGYWCVWRMVVYSGVSILGPGPGCLATEPT